jgi:hypothetical protein
MRIGPRLDLQAEPNLGVAVAVPLAAVSELGSVRVFGIAMSSSQLTTVIIPALHTETGVGWGCGVPLAATSRTAR